MPHSGGLPRVGCQSNSYFTSVLSIIRCKNRDCTSQGNIVSPCLAGLLKIPRGNLKYSEDGRYYMRSRMQLLQRSSRLVGLFLVPVHHVDTDMIDELLKMSFLQGHECLNVKVGCLM